MNGKQTNKLKEKYVTETVYGLQSLKYLALHRNTAAPWHGWWLGGEEGMGSMGGCVLIWGHKRHEEIN